MSSQIGTAENKLRAARRKYTEAREELKSALEGFQNAEKTMLAAQDELFETIEEEHSAPIGG